MEIETLKKDNRKYWVIGIIITVILVSTIFFVGTKANYKVTQKVNIANGTINWSPSDLDIMAIKVQNSSGGYDNANSVPTSGYILNSDKSICKSNGIQQENIRLEYKNGYLKVDKINQKGTKCEFFFDIKSGISVNDILASKIITGPRISGIHTINTTGHISEVLDDDGISYLYTGAVDDNWVKFGGFYWRIIRINGDGTIRMIYNGTTAFPVGSFTTINNEASYYFGLENGGRNNNMYVGYMYTNGDNHGTSNSSFVKQKIDEWYSINLNKEGIKEHIDANAGFCGDRGSNTNSDEPPNNAGGTGTTTTYYASQYRVYRTHTPSLKCADSRDLYTVSSSNKGNKALTYPVGLITSDEVLLAGGMPGENNTSYYLRSGSSYWTMTPYSYSGGGTNIWIVEPNGAMSYFSPGASLRPVINLKADTQFKSGTDGTTSKPYEVV